MVPWYAWIPIGFVMLMIFVPIIYTWFKTPK